MKSRSVRIETFDLLRGYFLLVILIDHFGHFPSWFDLATGRGELWASAAEGFFIISGLLVGYIRGKQAQAGKFGLAVRKLWQRSLVIYGWSVALTLLYTLAGRHWQHLPGLKPNLDVTSPLPELLRSILSLHYSYGWADFLVYYAVFLAVAPLALLLIRWRLSLLVAVITVGAWLGWSSNAFMAWQVYFFLGLVVGAYLRPLEAQAARIPDHFARSLRAALYAAAGVTAALSATLVHVPSVLTTHAYFGQAWLEPLRTTLMQWGSVTYPLFQKWTFAPGRLFIAALWFAALYVFVRRHEAWFVRRLGPLLLPVGRNSLFVYGAQSAILFAAGIIVPHTQGLWLNTLIAALLLALVWGLAKGWAWGLQDGRQAVRALWAK